MSNIIDIDFSMNKKKRKSNDDPYCGLSEEEYATTLLRLHRLEQKMQHELATNVKWMNEPDDPRIILERMETIYARFTGNSVHSLYPMKPVKKTLIDRVKDLWGC